MAEDKISILLSDVSIEGEVVEKDKIIIDAKINGDIKAGEIETHENSNIKGNIVSKIASLGGIIEFDNDINNCKKKQNEITIDIQNSIKNLKLNKQTGQLDQDKDGKIYQSALIFENGNFINIQCYEFSKSYKNKHNYVDNLKVVIVPKKFDDLVSLPGVGNKTASVFQNVILGLPRIAVDTHVFRVSNRIGIVSTKTTDKTQIQLEKVVPKKWQMIAHHLLILHGRRICKSQKPLCNHCSISINCQYKKIIN